MAERGKHMADINKVTLKGVLVMISSNPKTTLLTISIKDYRGKRDPNTGLPRKNMPVITFFGKEGQEIASKYNRGDHVTITGVIQNTYNHQQLEGRQECWGLSIQPTPSIAEAAGGENEGLTGRLYPDDVNEVVLKGKVTNVAANPGKNGSGTVFISIKTAVDGYRSNSSVLYPMKGADAFIKALTIGSTVTAVGKLSVAERPNRNDRKKKIRFEAVIVRELFVNNKASVQNNKTDENSGGSEQMGAFPEFG